MEISRKEIRDLCKEVLAKLAQIHLRLEAIEKGIVPKDKMMDTQDVATFLKVTPRSVQRWVKAGKIKSKKVAGIRLFSNNEILRFIREDYDW